jgi:ubiquinone/menaquinone biosynthesis C-methylase UbiE
MSSEWQSYDSVGEVHQKIAVPLVFEPPARDLVSILAPPEGSRVLDAGAGTGVAARLAAKLVGSGGVVVALDPAHGMIREAHQHGLKTSVTARLPSLPFRDSTFDGALAGFVLSHMSSPEAGAAEVLRVLRPGGRFAATSWANLDTPYRKAWYAVAASFVSQPEIEAAAEKGVPREEWLSDRTHCEQVFDDAGFVGVEVESRTYRFRMRIDEFLAFRENAMQGRFLRQRLDGKGFAEFRAAAASIFHERFSDPIEEERVVWFTMGSRG